MLYLLNRCSKSIDKKYDLPRSLMRLFGIPKRNSFVYITLALNYRVLDGIKKFQISNRIRLFERSS